MRQVSPRGRAMRCSLWLVAALLVPGHLLAGCDSTSAAPRRLAPIALAWHSATVPGGLVFSPAYLVQPLGIAPSDGATAYACAAPLTAQGTPRAGAPATTLQLWSTRDRGAHWSALPAPPTDQPATTCALVVDDLDAARVVLMVDEVETPTAWQAAFVAFVSYDGGQHWQPLPGGARSGIGQLATWGDVTYAVRGGSPVPAINQRLMVSRDRMQTWQPVDAPIVASGQGVIQFWLRPDTGELLAVGHDIHHDGRGLWSSADGGAHWAQLPVPYIQEYVAQPPVPGKPWQVCGEEVTPSDEQRAHPSPLLHLSCSQDGGRTWAQRPALTPATGERQALPSGAWGIWPLALAAGGDLLLVDAQGDETTLYRLRPGSAAWQSLGELPGTRAFATYRVLPGAGILWSVQSAVDPGASPIAASVSALATADYPAA